MTERSDLFLGAMTSVFMTVHYDCVEKRGLSLLIETLFELEGYEGEAVFQLVGLIGDSVEFNDYYNLIESPPEFDRNGRKRGPPPPRWDIRLVGALLCMDLMRDLNLLIDRNKFNFIIGEHFLKFHHYKLDPDILTQLRDSPHYRQQKKKMSTLLISKILHSKRQFSLSS